MWLCGDWWGRRGQRRGEGGFGVGVGSACTGIEI